MDVAVLLGAALGGCESLACLSFFLSLCAPKKLARLLDDFSPSLSLWW